MQTLEVVAFWPRVGIWTASIVGVLALLILAVRLYFRWLLHSLDSGPPNTEPLVDPDYDVKFRGWVIESITELASDEFVEGCRAGLNDKGFDNEYYFWFEEFPDFKPKPASWVVFGDLPVSSHLAALVDEWDKAWDSIYELKEEKGMTNTEIAFSPEFEELHRVSKLLLTEFRGPTVMT